MRLLALLPLLGERHRVLVAHLNALRRLLRDRSIEDVGAVVHDGRGEILHQERLHARLLVGRRRRDGERLPSVLVHVVLHVLDPRVVQLQLGRARAHGHAARLRLSFRLGFRALLRLREADLQRLEEVGALHLLELLRQLLELLVLDFRGHACLLAGLLAGLLACACWGASDSTSLATAFSMGGRRFQFFSEIDVLWAWGGP